ncbi:MAG TPA: carboxymuconolactone decarboxylase family protein [Mycobacteriales bacterium]|nr:carboxymuconolactone decarboxylase family protein [Mycobacteriales bacterium]
MTWVSTGDEQSDLPHILRSHSANREVLRGHLALYRAVMFGSSGLSRAEREAMAVAVSAVNDCHY